MIMDPCCESLAFFDFLMYFLPCLHERQSFIQAFRQRRRPTRHNVQVIHVFASMPSFEAFVRELSHVFGIESFSQDAIQVDNVVLHRVDLENSWRVESSDANVTVHLNPFLPRRASPLPFGKRRCTQAYLCPSEYEKLGRFLSS